MVFVIDKVRNFCNLRDFFVFYMEIQDIMKLKKKKRKKQIVLMKEIKEGYVC